jgi:hypothetical protein
MDAQRLSSSRPGFADRREAGVVLAERLRQFVNRTDIVVLALPRGGVPVGCEVAKALGAPLDVFVVRKLGLRTQTSISTTFVPRGRAGACDAGSAVRRTCGTRNSPAPSTLSGQSLAQRAGRRRKAGVDGVSERHIPRVTRLPHSHTHPFFVVEPSAGVGDRQRHRGQALGGRVDDHHGVLLPRLAGLLVRTPPQRSTTFSPR